MMMSLGLLGEALVILAEFPAALPLIQEYARRKPHDFDALYLSGVVRRGLGITPKRKLLSGKPPG